MELGYIVAIVLVFVDQDPPPLGLQALDCAAHRVAIGIRFGMALVNGLLLELDAYSTDLLVLYCFLDGSAGLRFAGWS